MATAAEFQPDGLQADPLADFVLVRTDQIDRGERLRALDPIWVEALSQVMRREGRQTPIEVCRLPWASRWTLVSGGHRHAAAELAGIVYMRAEIVGANRDDRRMREISENLWRRDLEPIDRAVFVAELVEIKRRAAGLTIADRRASATPAHFRKAIKAEADETLETISNVYGFTEEIGAELGFSGRTIRNDLMIYRGIAPSSIARLRDIRHPVATNATQLRALAKLEPGAQARVIDRLVNGGVKTVAAASALGAGGKAAPDPEAKRLSAFIGAFSRMSLTEKKGALAHLAGMLPADFALVEHGGTVASAGGAVLSKRGVDAVIAAISTGEFSHGLLEPAADSPARDNWVENGGYIAKGLRVIDGARRPS